MPTYHYTLASKEGKKLSGTVQAPSEPEARSELNNLGFSILSLKEASSADLEKAKSGKKFIFEGIDLSSKLVTGTIGSESMDKAYQRLQNEFNLTITAIWPEGASAEQIEEAKSLGTQSLQEALKEIPTGKSKKSSSKEKAKSHEILKKKIDKVVSDIESIISKYQNIIEPAQLNEIHKKIDKLLRIKNSTNLNYVTKTAEELINFLQEQEKTLMQKGYQDERIKLKMQTREMLRDLTEDEGKPKSLSEDIISKITNWQKSHKGEKEKAQTKIIGNFLESIKKAFETPPEVLAIKEQIKVYNKQIREFCRLYFKEPTKAYKEKMKNAIKTIWQARKKAKENLKKVKQELKLRKVAKFGEEKLILSFVEELNSLSGWLLSFYIIYYFVSLYISTKNFGLTEIPVGFQIYDSQFFKYILAILFFLHACTSLKVNFFRKSQIANIILIPVFVFASIISLLNF